MALTKNWVGRFRRRGLWVVGAAALGVVAGCAVPCKDGTCSGCDDANAVVCAATCKDGAFSKYDDAKAIEIIELARTSQSWDGAELPDYPVGKPELVVRRYVFPRGSKLGWHHHPVINYGILQQGELTIIGIDGSEKTVRAGEAVVEMVGTIHHGENRGDKTVILDMCYVSQEGIPVAVQHPEVE